MRLTLRAKFLIVITAAVLGMSGLILFVVGLLTAQEIDRSIRANVRATGNVLVQMMRERSAALESRCLTFVRQPVVKAYLAAPEPQTHGASARPDAATIADSLGEYLKEMQVTAAVITDRDGRSLGESGTGHPSGSDYSRERGIARAMNGLTYAGIQARGGKLMLTVSVPVTIHEEVWGTFTAYSAVDTSVAVALKRALGSDVAFVSNGIVAGTSRAAPIRLPTPLQAPAIVTLDGERFFALYAPLPGTRPTDAIGFVTLDPYDKTLALYQRFRMALAGAFMVALVLAPLAGFTLANGITRPLDGVVRAARRLQAGVWPEPFQTHRSDEIGLLQTVFDDMTHTLRSNEERLLALIDIDTLTELDNHRRFQERLAQEAQRCKSSGQALSLLMVDMDNFHQFNVEKGHQAGDQALKRLSLILKNCLPDFAIIARYGGEEFTVLLPNHDLDSAHLLAERIRAAAEGQRREAGPAGLTVSIGCAEFGKHTSQAEGLVMAAELALSTAKHLGRNRVCRFDSVPGANETADPYHLHRFLKDGSLATIQALAAAVDAKDPYTQGHSARVAHYASQLAAWVRRSQLEIDLIHTTGTLHDVGKIGVPDSILQKPGRLDEHERSIMETHPVLGEVIVRKAPQLLQALPGVRHHHERWDGRGYPDRLAGPAIPEIARILAIADTFDAMTSDRPYRKGLDAEIALEEIARGAGSQFDPDLATAFVEMMRADGALLRAA